jgi:hypothetical protein
MTPKEFLKSKRIEFDHDVTMSAYVRNAGSTINAITKLLKQYHQHKLKLLGIAGNKRINHNS